MRGENCVEASVSVIRSIAKTIDTTVIVEVAMLVRIAWATLWVRLRREQQPRNEVADCRETFPRTRKAGRHKFPRSARSRAGEGEIRPEAHRAPIAEAPAAKLVFAYQSPGHRRSADRSAVGAQLLYEFLMAIHKLGIDSLCQNGSKNFWSIWSVKTRPEPNFVCFLVGRCGTCVALGAGLPMMSLKRDR